MADAIGCPLTLSVTLNFSIAGVAPDAAVGIFRRLRTERFNKWASRPTRGRDAFEPTYAFVFENKRGSVVFEDFGEGCDHNVHVHWIVHVPPERRHDFYMRLFAWMDELTDTLCPANTIRIDPIYNIKTLRPYALKGAQEGWAERFGSGAMDQGIIVGGGRSGTSANLSVSARRRFDRHHGIKRRALSARGSIVS